MLSRRQFDLYLIGLDACSGWVVGKGSQQKTPSILVIVVLLWIIEGQISHLQLLLLVFLRGFGEFRWQGRASFNPPSSFLWIWVVGGILTLSLLQKGYKLGSSCDIPFLGGFDLDSVGSWWVGWDERSTMLTLRGKNSTVSTTLRKNWHLCAFLWRTVFCSSKNLCKKGGSSEFSLHGIAQFRLADLNWPMAVSKSFLILCTYHVFDLLMSWYSVLHFDSTVRNLELVCHLMANWLVRKELV